MYWTRGKPLSTETFSGALPSSCETPPPTLLPAGIPGEFLMAEPLADKGGWLLFSLLAGLFW